MCACNLHHGGPGPCTCSCASHAKYRRADKPSGREWKPGDVAMVSALNKPEPYRAYFDGEAWREYGHPMWCVNSPHTYRPLVVIDPEDREQVAGLSRALSSHGLAFCNEGDVQAALRSLIAPPRPDEPTGLGAVVEDEDGADWHRTRDGRWIAGDGLRCRAGGWSHIAAVRILSEGVQPC